MADLSNPQLVKVQIVAEFVLDDGDYKMPGTFGPVQLTAREWVDFDLQAAIEAGVAEHQEPAPKPPANRAARRARKSKAKA